MRSRFQWLGLYFIFLVLLSGCVISENMIDKEYAASYSTLLGDYYVTNESGVREDIKIWSTGDKRYPIGLSTHEGAPKSLDRFQIYRIGSNTIAFIHFVVGDTNQSIVGRIDITKTQIAFYYLSEEFFKKNPSALPGTKADAGGVSLTATPEQLRVFFMLHDQNKDIWESKPEILLNRIGT